jgi:hypothetical protein
MLSSIGDMFPETIITSFFDSQLLWHFGIFLVLSYIEDVLFVSYH